MFQKRLHTVSTLKHHLQSSQPTRSLILKILPHTITVSPMYTLILWTHARLNQFPHSAEGIHMERPLHFLLENNPRKIHMDNLLSLPVVYTSPLLHMYTHRRPRVHPQA
ncbi:unnamed protein product, partial [Brassica oleracea]